MIAIMKLISVFTTQLIIMATLAFEALPDLRENKKSNNEMLSELVLNLGP